MQTLPQLALEWGESVDELREMIRRRPDLGKLAVHYGAARVFNEAAAKLIRAALRERRAAQQARAAHSAA